MRHADRGRGALRRPGTATTVAVTLPREGTFARDPRARSSLPSTTECLRQVPLFLISLTHALSLLDRFLVFRVLPSFFAPMCSLSFHFPSCYAWIVFGHHDVSLSPYRIL